MKKSPLRPLLVVFSGITLGTLAHGATTFTSGNITSAGNWSNGLPVVSTNVGAIGNSGNFSGNIASWEVNHTAGTLTSSSNRTVGAADASSLGTIWNLSGGSIDFGSANFNRGTIGSNYAYLLNIDSGSLSAGSLQNTAGTTINLSGGTITLSATHAMANGILNLNAGSFTAGALTTNSSSRINFFTDSTATFTISGLLQADYENLWSGGILRFDGGNDGDFSDHFQVEGSTLSVIPEPAASLLGAMGILALLRRKRTD